MISPHIIFIIPLDFLFFVLIFSFVFGKTWGIFLLGKKQLQQELFNLFFYFFIIKKNV